jgi:hypothetical protein
MGKTSKYEGGSREISFRLPLKHFDEAKKTIDAYLMRFEIGHTGPHSLRPVTPEEAISEIVVNGKEEFENISKMRAAKKKFDHEFLQDAIPVPKKTKEGLVYPCGCTHDGVLFRRSEKCHLEVGKHIK